MVPPPGAAPGYRNFQFRVSTAITKVALYKEWGTIAESGSSGWFRSREPWVTRVWPKNNQAIISVMVRENTFDISVDVASHVKADLQRKGLTTAIYDSLYPRDLPHSLPS